jgi:hypothetical protein
MKIVICGSASFIPQCGIIRETLVRQGHRVFGLDLWPAVATPEEARLQWTIGLREHLRYIGMSDAIFVVNFEKGGIKNYIGVDVLFEMGYAFDRNKKIFVLSPLPDLSYKEELVALKPIILNGHLTAIDSH